MITTATSTFVNAYTLTRHFGGPEEGGWWYNAGEPLASIPLPFTPTGHDDGRVAPMITQLKQRYADQEHGDIHSALGGAEVVVYLEDHPARSFPRENPRYE